MSPEYNNFRMVIQPIPAMEIHQDTQIKTKMDHRHL